MHLFNYSCTEYFNHAPTVPYILNILLQLSAWKAMYIGEDESDLRLEPRPLLLRRDQEPHLHAQEVGQGHHQHLGGQMRPQRLHQLWLHI